jgi:hypothetical protein
MSLSSVVKNVGKATNNPILMTAGQIGELLGFRARAAGRPQKKKSQGARGSGKRRVRGPNSVDTYGGPVVQTVNAPVAFARVGDLKPFMKMKDTGNGLVVHSVDMVGQVVSGGTANVFQSVFSFALNPTSTTNFPYLGGTIAPAFEKFRIKMVRLHYVHFCPTSTQGAVYLWANPDTLASAPTASSVLLNDSNTTQGAVYEDLQLRVDLSAFNAYSDWMYVGTSATDTRMNSGGVVGIFVENTAATVGLGNFYVETVFEFSARKLPSQNEPLALARQIMCGELDTALKRQALHRLVDAIPESTLQLKPKQKEETEEDAIARKLVALSQKGQPAPPIGAGPAVTPITSRALSKGY